MCMHASYKAIYDYDVTHPLFLLEKFVSMQWLHGHVMNQDNIMELHTYNHTCRSQMAYLVITIVHSHNDVHHSIFPATALQDEGLDLYTCISASFNFYQPIVDRFIELIDRTNSLLNNVNWPCDQPHPLLVCTLHGNWLRCMCKGGIIALGTHGSRV